MSTINGLHNGNHGDVAETNEWDDDGVGWYELKVGLKSMMNREPLNADFIDEFEGDVLACDIYGNEIEVAGHFKAIRIRSEDAARDGVHPAYVWDEDQQLWDYFLTLFRASTQDYRPHVEKQFEPFSRDVLILDKIEIRPQHRGCQLRLAVASRLIDLLADPTGLVACIPAPLQFLKGYRKGEEKWEDLGLGQLDRNEDRARKKLQAYWGRLRFKRVRRGSLYFPLSPGWRRPTIEELCPKLP